MSSWRYFHGGPRGLKMILPSSQTGAPSLASYGGEGICRRDAVYITTDPDAALIYAAGHHSLNGTVYEVEPVGELRPDPDCTLPGLAFEASSARVIREMRPRGKDLKKVRRELVGRA